MAMRQVPALVVLFLLVGVSQSGAQSPLLEPADVSPLNVGGTSGQVLLADINDDGHLDLLTRHPQGRAIRTHLGDGEARFRTTRTVALKFSPSDMSVGDVNGDRIVDLVVTAGSRDVVDVLLGTGSGVLRHAKGAPFDASKRVYRYNKRRLHLVDVDGDGHLDIVTENRRGQYAFRVLRGDGRGRFAPGPVLTVEPAHEGYTLAFGDVDGDGDVDAVTAVSSPTTGRLAVHVSNGRGAFTRLRSSVVSLPAPYQIEALADVNADRRPDLVLTHRSARVSILLNRGGGRFTHASGSPIGAGARPFGVAMADLNGDDDMDLVGATVDRVTVLLGNGRGLSPAGRSTFPAGPGAFDVATGDVNDDGRTDVLASSFESNAVTVLLGR
jgi:hypothetical protein